MGEMTAKLNIRLEPAIADIIRTKASLPHQFNPPASWMALGYLAAVRLGARLWLSNGRALWSATDDVWHFADHPDIASIIAEHGYPPGEAVQAVPRAFPLGALGRDTMLWILRWYDSDHKYVCTPIMLDAAHREVRVLRSRRRKRIDGAAPRRLRTTRDPDRFVIAGQVDAGAIANLDTFIMVDVAWEVDLIHGTYHSVKAAAGGSTGGLAAVSHLEELSHGGLSYHRKTITKIDADKSTFTLHDRDGILILELHTTGHATVRVDRLPTA
jgi:hypothetical protein